MAHIAPMFSFGGTRSDIGWITSATILQGMSVAVAALQVNAATKLGNAQLAIARDQYQLAKELQDYFLTSFKQREISLLNQAFDDPNNNYNPQYDWRAGQFMSDAKARFAGIADKVACLGERYCVGFTTDQVKDVLIAEAQAVADAANFGYRYEEGRKLSLDDVWWSRKMQAVGLGRNLLATALSYGMSAAKNENILRASAEAGAGSALSAFGYFNGLSQQQNQFQQASLKTT